MKIVQQRINLISNSKNLNKYLTQNDFYVVILQKNKNMRKILIIISSILILILFGIVSSVSYDMGISHGVKNAEKIRSENNKESLEIEKEIPTVNFKTAKNEISKIKINVQVEY